MRYFSILLLFLMGCSATKTPVDIEKDSTYSYLALGDSYTIGESVCETCNFPQQLTDSLNTILKEKISVNIIAKTGWTTTDLLGAIASENPPKDYDFVTLLIGVNNQYQNKPFSIYEEDFPRLVDMAISFAKGKKENVIILSIPDYAFTPFGQKKDPEKISKELDQYNAFAKKIAVQKGVRFEDITELTRKGLINKNLVAWDGLHPSVSAYKGFVGLIFEKALTILK